MIIDAKIVAEGWLDLLKLDINGKSDARDETLGTWARELLMIAIWNDAAYALEIVFAIHELEMEPWMIPVFAAGPVEDLLVRQGPSVIDAIESKVAEDESFAYLLEGIYKSKMDDAVWERVLKCRKTAGCK